jgi:hypothetical protein
MAQTANLNQQVILSRYGENLMFYPDTFPECICSTG